MQIHVRLGEGFKNDTVSVRANGTAVYQRAGVSTDYTISRADAFDVRTDAPRVTLDVAVHNGPHLASEIVPAQTPFVELRLVDGKLELHALAQEPPMM